MKKILAAACLLCAFGASASAEPMAWLDSPFGGRLYCPDPRIIDAVKEAIALPGRRLHGMEVGGSGSIHIVFKGLSDDDVFIQSGAGCVLIQRHHASTR